MITFVRKNCEVETQLIDGQIVFTSMNLQYTREKTLREEQARQPVGFRQAMGDPKLNNHSF